MIPVATQCRRQTSSCRPQRLPTGRNLQAALGHSVRPRVLTDGDGNCLTVYRPPALSSEDFSDGDVTVKLSAAISGMSGGTGADAGVPSGSRRQFKSGTHTGRIHPWLQGDARHFRQPKEIS